jgi:hypothetical protein
MPFIEDVKRRLGILYSDMNKDIEIDQMIEGAKLYFKGAGWDIDSTPSSLATEAVVLYCKMAQSTDPAQLINHPVLVSFITQNRAGG